MYCAYNLKRNGYFPKSRKSVVRVMEKHNKESTEKLFNSLSPEQQKQVQNILSDKNKMAEILNSPQAQAILKKLTGGK